MFLLDKHTFSIRELHKIQTRKSSRACFPKTDLPDYLAGFISDFSHYSSIGSVSAKYCGATSFSHELVVREIFIPENK